MKPAAFSLVTVPVKGFPSFVKALPFLKKLPASLKLSIPISCKAFPVLPCRTAKMAAPITPRAPRPYNVTFVALNFDFFFLFWGIYWVEH